MYTHDSEFGTRQAYFKNTFILNQSVDAGYTGRILLQRISRPAATEMCVCSLVSAVHGAERWNEKMTQSLYADNSFAIQNGQRSAITGRGAGRFPSLVPDMGAERWPER